MSKEHKHIDDVEKMEEVTRELEKVMYQCTSDMLLFAFASLSKYEGGGFDLWYESQKRNLRNYFKEASKLAKQSQKKLIKDLELNEGILSPKGLKTAKKVIQEGYKEMLNTNLNEHKKAIENVKERLKQEGTEVLSNNVAEALHQAITEHVKQNVDNGVVIYANGRKYHWENYMDMKLRTEIKKDISNQMIQSGHENGVVFYSSSFYGDCAKDHVEYNGRIFYDKDYASMIEDVETLKKIEEYIHSNNLETIQDAVTEKCSYYTVRPNCRHFFEFMPTEDVIEIIEGKSLDKYREENDLNFNGKYKPEKYEALQDQRHNERQIRKYKSRVDVLNERLDNLPSDASDQLKESIKNDIKTQETYVRKYQKEQRELVKKNPFLDRQYRREANGRVINHNYKRK